MTLPEGWDTTTLADCQARTRSLDPRQFGDEAFDLFSVPSYADYRPETAVGGEIGSTKQEVQEGDVLLCKIVPHIRRGWVVPPANGRRQIASGEWIVFRDHGLEPEYLRRFVLSDGFHEQFMQTVSGVGGSLMRARPAEAGKIEVPIPPLAEQRRIVAKLNALTTRLARARAELDRVPLLAKRLRETVLGWAFDRGSLSTGSGTPISGLCLSITDGDHQAPPKAADGIPFITISAMNNGRIDLGKATRFVPPSYQEGLKDSRRPRIGDVLYSVTGSIGIPALVRDDEPFVFQRHIAILRPDQARCDPAWLAHILAAPQVRTQAYAVATGTAQLTIPLGGLRAFTVPAIDLDKQRLQNAHIGAAFARADLLGAEAARARALLDRLEAAILARAFRGELVPQDPNDEPASILLDRIRAQRAAASTLKRHRRRARESQQDVVA